MSLFLVLPILMMVCCPSGRRPPSDRADAVTLQSWVTFLHQRYYPRRAVDHGRLWLIVLAASLVVGYPAALYVGLFVKNKTRQTVCWFSASFHFWTSFLIRVWPGANAG